MQAKKALLKKKPSRRTGFTYWNADQFAKLQTAPAAKLASRGRLTWRWLAFLLDASPAVTPIRDVIRGRLSDLPTIEAELKRLTKMLVTLAGVGVVVLDPPAPAAWTAAARPTAATGGTTDAGTEPAGGEDEVDAVVPAGPLAGRLTLGESAAAVGGKTAAVAPSIEPYDPTTATPTPRLAELTVFRAVHPLYGLWLMDHLAKADDHELIQVLESLLEMPGTVAKSLRVPPPEDLPPGRLATEFIDPALLTRGLASADDLYPPADQSDVMPELRRWPIPLAQKVRMLFESEIDHAGGLSVTPVWCVGDLLHHGGDFDRFVRSRDLTKQEGIVFKHLLRTILLCGEFARLTPTDADAVVWRDKLNGIATALTETCRRVDPQSTDELLEEADDAL